MHRHHIVYRSAGGSDEIDNVVSLCAICHAAEHSKQLYVIDRDANATVRFEVLEVAVLALFGTKSLPPHVSIILPDGDRW